MKRTKVLAMSLMFTSSVTFASDLISCPQPKTDLVKGLSIRGISSIVSSSTKEACVESVINAFVEDGSFFRYYKDVTEQEFRENSRVKESISEACSQSRLDSTYNTECLVDNVNDRWWAEHNYSDPQGLIAIGRFCQKSPEQQLEIKETYKLYSSRIDMLKYRLAGAKNRLDVMITLTNRDGLADKACLADVVANFSPHDSHFSYFLDMNTYCVAKENKNNSFRYSKAYSDGEHFIIMNDLMNGVQTQMNRLGLELKEVIEVRPVTERMLALDSSAPSTAPSKGYYFDGGTGWSEDGATILLLGDDSIGKVDADEIFQELNQRGLLTSKE